MGVAVAIKSDARDGIAATSHQPLDPRLPVARLGELEVVGEGRTGLVAGVVLLGHIVPFVIDEHDSGELVLVVSSIAGFSLSRHAEVGDLDTFLLADEASSGDVAWLMQV